MTDSGVDADEVVDVSVVICAYTLDRWADLRSSVESILTQTAPAHQVIVVIDHDQRLYERARDRFDTCTVVENVHEPGLSGARNTGVDLADGTIVAFIDDDAVAQPDWLERLVSAYTDRSVIGVGGQAEANWLNSRPDWFPPEFEWVVGCSYTGLPATTADIRNPIGTNMSFRRDAFEVAGNFHAAVGRREANGLGCEETEFSIRATRAIDGSRIVYEPSARVRHSVPATRATWVYFTRRCWGEGWSKALVSSMVGRGAASHSERRYVLHVLPRGLLATISSAWRTRRPQHLLRIPAITLGVATTTAGYAACTLYRLIGSRATFGRSVPSAASD